MIERQLDLVSLLILWGRYQAEIFDISGMVPDCKGLCMPKRGQDNVFGTWKYLWVRRKDNTKHRYLKSLYG